MLIQRIIKKKIVEKLQGSNKIVLIFGARQVGKTTLCREVIQNLDMKTLSVNADELRVHNPLSSRDSRKLTEFIHGYDLLFIDEAQRIPDIGINLKILHDTIPALKILVTGSSSFELARQSGEPLIGRKWSFTLYPIAQCERAETLNTFELNEDMNNRLVWGSYPEIFSLEGSEEKRNYLSLLQSDHLFKDIFLLSGIRQPDQMRKLLQLLAFQIGSEVSLHEIGAMLSLSNETVARYVYLLERAFIIFHLSGFSRNLRKEVTKMNKYYFYDCGVRNAAIDNFKSVEERNDVGQLWENFLISERIRRNEYSNSSTTSYFWRTYTGAEIDYIEDGGGKLSGHEFKWGRKKTRAPKAWHEQYKDSSWEVIDQSNWLDFVL